eukprot:10019001-Alexandrium_andersonii.AAC.1
MTDKELTEGGSASGGASGSSASGGLPATGLPPGFNTALPWWKWPVCPPVGRSKCRNTVLGCTACLSRREKWQN